MQSREIRLGEREFVIVELPLRANVEWRREFEAKLEPLLGLLTGLDKLEINSPKDLGQIVTMLRQVLLRAPDTLIDLLFAYSGALEQDREWIETNVYESELLTAVTEVLQLAYPFGQVFKMARNLSGVAGQRTAPISTNLSSPSGPAPRGRTKSRT